MGNRRKSDYDRGRTFPIDALDEERIWRIGSRRPWRTMKSTSPNTRGRRLSFCENTPKKLESVGTPATLANAEALVTAINVGQGELDGKAPTVGHVPICEKISNTEQVPG